MGVSNFQSLEDMTKEYNKLTGANLKTFKTRAIADKYLADAKSKKKTPVKANKKGKAKPKKPTVKKEDRVFTEGKGQRLRHKVKVGGEIHNSVRAAFEALKLPLGQHIKFRMELKATASGVKSFDGHKFTLVEAKAKAKKAPAKKAKKK